MSSLIKEAFMAFAFCAFLCSIAQILLDKTSLTPARILVFFAVSGVVLGAFGIYPYLTELFGVGATLPLSGFGAAIAKGVREAVDKEGLIGVIKGPMSAAAAGTTLAFLLGFTFSTLTKSRPKRM